MNGLPLVTIEYVEFNRKPHIVLFLREGKHRVLKDISGFRPYFYVKSSPKTEGSFTTIDGETVGKIYTVVPGDVLQERKMYDKTWEADVRFTQRYLIDCVPTIEKCELRVQYTDIEMDVATNNIISIAVYDNYLQKCTAFVWREDLPVSQYDREYSFPSGYTFKSSVNTYNSKSAMFVGYINFVKSTDPDILTGWFSTAFDFKHILQQIVSCKLDAGDLSPLHKAYILGDEVSKLESNIKIAGRVLWDMLKAYANLQPGRLADSSLEGVAQKVLGEGKHKHKPFSELWKDIDELIEYNTKDCILVYRIDQKKHILDYYDTLRRFVGCEWHSLVYETLLWDAYILHKLHNKIVLPSKIKIKMLEYEGSTVLLPISKGIHKIIILLDLKSLYPSIIITFNMSPETVSKCKNSENCYCLPNGIAFTKDKVGIIPECLIELMKMRAEAQQSMKKFPFGTSEYEALDAQQTAMKVLCNALYGGLAYENFRLCTPEIASSVTFVGRNILEFIVKTVESMGLKIIAGDTDSVFIKANATAPKEVYKEMCNIVESINAKLPTFVKSFGNSDNCTIKIEPKKIYESLMISEKKTGNSGETAKKRYAGLIMWTDGNFIDAKSEAALDIMGFESKRSDSSEFSRDLQRRVIRMFLEGSPKADQKSYIVERTRYISGDCDYEYVGIPKGLSQSLQSYRVDNPHRRAAIYSNENLGSHFGIGDKPRIIYVSSTGKYPKTDVVAFSNSEDLPPDFKMDVNTMIQKCIYAKVEHIFDAAGLDISEVLSNTSSLEEFF